MFIIFPALGPKRTRHQRFFAIARIFWEQNSNFSELWHSWLDFQACFFDPHGQSFPEKTQKSQKKVVREWKLIYNEACLLLEISINFSRPVWIVPPLDGKFCPRTNIQFLCTDRAVFCLLLLTGLTFSRYFFWFSWPINVSSRTV